MASFLGQNVNIPIGENLQITDLQEMIMDPAYEDSLVTLLKSVSTFYINYKARRKLEQLRQIRTVEIPIPYVFESRPRTAALRPMVDVLFPPSLMIAKVPWSDCIEYVSETELRDRVETAGYDKDFVEEAIEHRGPTSRNWRLTTATERAVLRARGNNNGYRH